jgi:lipid II:glycine glycyltransferase (peptidoglycan interpeptide bridge formation enzyme)
MLEEDRSRHGARPTHTLHELQRIFDLVSDKTRLFLCNLGEELVAATVVFEMNDRVAYSFYPCHDSRFDEHRPLMLLNVAVAEAYAGRGFSYLDLGPSTFDDMSPNDGLIRFKEELGAIGFCRDSWRWESAD